MSTVYLEQLPRIRAKFDKIAERAANRGFTGGLTLAASEPYERTEGGPYPIPTYSRTVVDLDVTGKPPRFDGWTVTARVDIVPSGRAVAINAPGVEEVIALDDYTPGSCDHCHTTRFRNHTYVVQHENGNRKFVGSTCLKDFLGWSASPYLVFSDHIDVDELVATIEFDPTYSLVEILTFAELSIRDRGYIRTSDAYDGGPEPTKYDVLGALIARSSSDRRRRAELAAALSEKANDVHDTVTKIINYIRSDDFAGDSSYVATLKVLLDEQSIESKHLGYVVSAPQAYRRYLETETERKAREDRRRAASELHAAALPVPNGRHTVEGTVISTRVQENYFAYNAGPTPKMVVLDDRGFKVWSTVPAKITPAGDLDELIGTRIQYTATLERSREDSAFGFAKRPSKATVVEDANAVQV